MRSEPQGTQGQSSRLRDWIDPRRIYNPVIPAGRFVFLWGLLVYPVVVMFLLLTVPIILVESFASSANATDYLGIVTWIFMLAWVTAAVCICRRRLKDLGMSQAWIWLAILPVVDLFLFLYLLLKPGRFTGHRVTEEPRSAH